MYIIPRWEKMQRLISTDSIINIPEAGGEVHGRRKSKRSQNGKTDAAQLPAAGGEPGEIIPADFFLRVSLL